MPNAPPYLSSLLLCHSTGILSGDVPLSRNVKFITKAGIRRVLIASGIESFTQTHTHRQIKLIKILYDLHDCTTFNGAYSGS